MKHEAFPARGTVVRDAWGDIVNGAPRRKDQWPLYATCTCGEIIYLPRDTRVWEH